MGGKISSLVYRNSVFQIYFPPLPYFEFLGIRNCPFNVLRDYFLLGWYHLWLILCSLLSHVLKHIFIGELFLILFKFYFCFRASLFFIYFSLVLSSKQGPKTKMYLCVFILFYLHFCVLHVIFYWKALCNIYFKKCSIVYYITYFLESLNCGLSHIFKSPQIGFLCVELIGIHLQDRFIERLAVFFKELFKVWENRLIQVLPKS